MLTSGIPTHTPCLKFEVKGQAREFELDRDDIRKGFQTFGEVVSAKVIGHIALILFRDVVSAFFA